MFAVTKKKKMKKTLIGLLFISSVMSFNSCSKKISKISDKGDLVSMKINKIGDSLLLKPEFRAISVGVIANNKVYKIHKGVLRSGKKPTSQTSYEIASLTKTFTGTLLAYAITEGKVAIDDDIRKYLPEKYPNLEFNGQPITFRNLVTHQSGLPHMFPNKMEVFNNPNWDKLPFTLNEMEKGYTKQKFFNDLKLVKLDTVPGVKFGYSNAGANLLGYILENIYQTTFEDLISNKILKPLKMSNTQAKISKADKRYLAVGQNSNMLEMPFRVEKDMNAEGGMISTVEDMIKYMKFHLNFNIPVISTSHQELWKGQFGDFEAGMFWQIYKDGDKPDKIFQNGGAFGTSSWITLIPERKIGVFIITNVAGQTVHQNLNQAVEKIINEITP
ncbi:MAG: serine hydrolase domain-containing protein [Spirosomataceae bacterium]